jgi:hypothetical protein
MDRVFASNISASPPTATGGVVGYPQDGNPSTSTPPTVPGARWFAMITESLLNLLDTAGIAHNGADWTLVRQAVQEIATTIANSAASAAQAAAIAAAASDATTKANNARTGAVSDVNAEFTGSHQGLGLPGFQKFPGPGSGASGGWIFQILTASVAGVASTSVTFPFAFPTAIAGVVAVPTGATLPSTPVTVVSQTASGCVIDCQSSSDTPGATLIAWGW